MSVVMKPGCSCSVNIMATPFFYTVYVLNADHIGSAIINSDTSFLICLFQSQFTNTKIATKLPHLHPHKIMWFMDYATHIVKSQFFQQECDMSWYVECIHYLHAKF
jgi:hypothetical protein